MKARPYTIIQKATEILIDGTWLQLAFCLDADGNRVMPDSKKARQFDMMACLWSAAGTMRFPKEAGNILGGICDCDTVRTYPTWNSYFIVSFNDNKNTTKEKAIQALDAAYIVSLQEEGLDIEDLL